MAGSDADRTGFEAARVILQEVRNVMYILWRMGGLTLLIVAARACCAKCCDNGFQPFDAILFICDTCSCSAVYLFVSPLGITDVDLELYLLVFIYQTGEPLINIVGLH